MYAIDSYRGRRLIEKTRCVKVERESFFPAETVVLQINNCKERGKDIGARARVTRQILRTTMYVSRIII